MFSFLFKKRRKEEKKEIVLYETMIVPVVELSPVLVSTGLETIELPATPRLRRLFSVYVIPPLFTMPIKDGDIPLREREP